MALKIDLDIQRMFKQYRIFVKFWGDFEGLFALRRLVVAGFNFTESTPHNTGGRQMRTVSIPLSHRTCWSQIQLGEPGGERSLYIKLVVIPLSLDMS